MWFSPGGGNDDKDVKSEFGKAWVKPHEVIVSSRGLLRWVPMFIRNVSFLLRSGKREVCILAIPFCCVWLFGCC